MSNRSYKQAALPIKGKWLHGGSTLEIQFKHRPALARFWSEPADIWPEFTLDNLRAATVHFPFAISAATRKAHRFFGQDISEHMRD